MRTAYTSINFNPGLALTGFRTTCPRLQVSLTCARDPIANQRLVSGQLKKKTRQLHEL